MQLIRAANDSHLWAETFDRRVTDIFSVESEVAKAIADQLQAHLSGREEQVIAAKPTDNPEAYDAYLRGLAYTLKTGPSPADALGAQKYLREAVRLQPKFALSWALLSYVDALGYLTLNLQPTVALREEARPAAETALALQPNLGEAVLAQGILPLRLPERLRHRGALPSAQRVSFCRTAARFLNRWPMSRADEASGTGASHTSTRPSGSIRATLTYSAHTQHPSLYWRRFPEAQRKFDQVLNITPDDVDTLAQKAAIAQAEGDLPRAVISCPCCIRTPTTPPPWERKFTKRFWSAALHKSSLDEGKS